MTKHEIIWRRGKLLAELFLQDLQPQNLMEVSDNPIFDYFAGFRTKAGALITIGVQVKATEQPIRDAYPLQVSRPRLEDFTNSNIPVLFLIVDVKENQIFFAWASAIDPRKAAHTTALRVVKLPVKKADAPARAQLMHEIEALAAPFRKNR
jgi:hypothetical protein